METPEGQSVEAPVKFVILCAGALPGELLTARITKTRKGTAPTICSTSAQANPRNMRQGFVSRQYPAFLCFTHIHFSLDACGPRLRCTGSWPLVQLPIWDGA